MDLDDRMVSEWRELGFFYDRDDDLKRWRLIGSRSGLLRFAVLLRSYISDPRNAAVSEHEHYGPYMYLEIMTWPTAGMDSHSIHGSLNDLGRLADIVEGKVAMLTPGGEAHIQSEYSPVSEYALVLQLCDDAYDPGSADRG